MPDHYHFILTQLEENGIRKFIQRLTNSYAHFFNIRHNQKGPLFERARHYGRGTDAGNGI